MATNKIIALGLQKTVEELISAGIRTSTKISEALKARNYPVSQSTVSRYLASVEEERKADTQSIVSDHVRAKVPEDLTALEAMEAQCLSWAGENTESFAHRLAGKHILDAAQSWVEQLNSLTCLDAKARNKALESIIEQCLGWIADDLKLQNARLAAMKQAASIINMKLSYALGENKDGAIYFLEKGDKVQRDEETGRVMVFPGGNG